MGRTLSSAAAATLRSTFTAAVIGNPNTGKTTLFNALTGLSQKVANYPGVTVERKAGRFALGGGTVELVDLPGTYSLAARSLDEMIAVDVLLASMDELLGLSNAMPKWLDPDTASQRLRGSARQNLMVRYVAVLDGTGKALASSDPAGASLSVQLPAGFLESVLEQPVSTLMVSAPVLLVVLVVGLVVSVFQAATQINEATLSFVPKIIAAVVVLAVAGPWMMTTLVEYLQRVLQSIPQAVG